MNAKHVQGCQPCIHISLILLAVSEAEFLTNYKKNPKNLRSEHDYCKNAKRRYKLHPDHHYAISGHKYLAYEECLPGCVVKKNYTKTIQTALAHSGKKEVLLTNDAKCVAYDNKMENLNQCSNSSKAIGNIYNSLVEGMLSVLRRK